MNRSLIFVAPTFEYKLLPLLPDAATHAHIVGNVRQFQRHETADFPKKMYKKCVSYCLPYYTGAVGWTTLYLGA